MRVGTVYHEQTIPFNINFAILIILKHLIIDLTPGFNGLPYRLHDETRNLYVSGFSAPNIWGSIYVKNVWTGLVHVMSFRLFYPTVSMSVHHDAARKRLGPDWFRFTPVRCQAIIYINDDFWSTILTIPRDILQRKNVRNQPNSITIFHLKSSLLILPQLCPGGDDIISRSICLVLKYYVYKCCIPYPVWSFFISADWSID